MRIKIALLIGAFFLMLFMIESALAGSIRCGTHLISDGGRHGPGMYEVMKKCGEPTHMYGSTWIYERSGEPRKKLHFNSSGMLEKISEE